MDYREGYLAEEGFAAEPEHGGAILTSALENRRVLKFGVCLPHNIDSLILEVLQVQHESPSLKDKSSDQGKGAKYYGSKCYDQF